MLKTFSNLKQTKIFQVQNNRKIYFELENLKFPKKNKKK